MSAALAAVLFDMDGTLLDSEKVWEIGLNELCDRLGGTLSPRARAELVGQDQTSSMHIVHADLGLPADGAAESAAWLQSRVKQLFSGTVEWRPGAPELLKEVRAAGLPTALVTATVRELVDVVIGDVGEENFDAVVCGDEVEQNKPAPVPYLAAARALGADPRHCVAVEDSPTGVASALAAGCAVLAVPSETPVPPAEGLTLRRSLTEVDLELLHSLPPR